MLNKNVLTAALATTLMAGAITAQGAPEISGNIALTNDYRFRGISQSDESPAISGGFDIAWDTGIYVGTWASSVDFDSNDDYDGSLELDYYAGWAGDLTDNVGVDVGVMAYTYPGDNGAEGDYNELYLNVSLFGGSVGAVYSDDYYAESGKFYYLTGDYSFPLGEVFSLDLHAGYADVEKNGGFFSSDTDSYFDYSAGISASWLAVDWSVAYIGTDLDKGDVFGTDWAEDTVVFTISKSM